ncbi:MAG TPA: HAD-IB family hydrolase [Solirubrobacteraceae bacterium]
MSASPNGARPDGAPADGARVDSARGAAFFDLDKTLMAGSSGVFFARAAYETGMISRSRLVKDVYENVRFRLLGSTDDRADDVRKRVGEMIAGVRVRDLERLSPRVLSGVLPRLYPEMLERAYAHQDAGVPVFILTAASQEMADLLARVLAFDGGLGSRSEIVDGRYTGRPAGPFNYREGKVLAMKELAEREGLELSRSYAYSDSESDLPMLRAVGHAVVVNPDARLRRIAAEQSWEVIELDRLGRRLKMLAALGAGTALASAGRALMERAGVARTGERSAAGRGAARRGRAGGRAGGRGAADRARAAGRAAVGGRNVAGQRRRLERRPVRRRS